ncbi:hypothetical protein SDC9_37313 [bioreactor metagenome]|uniref:Uncharacterized protein n=1 Tax=bioreactor metagenome TaxID=1076179 RepID=A0A644VJ28_9ZZZZ|nr:hypothetical protein [Negativicutes bacterium]
MSAFLGHIHYWLYNKIKRVVEREKLIYIKAEEKWGADVDELQQQVWQTYGEPLPDGDLADLIDQSNIHGWLQRQINVAETREAALIKELLDLHGDEAKAVIEEAFVEHGIMCGRHAKDAGSYNVSEIDGLYKALNDYLLNGMPCDQGDTVVENTPTRLVWEGEVCLQERNWSRTGVDYKVMKMFYQRWLASFVDTLNPSFTYRQTADTLAGDKVNRHEFVTN